MIASLFKLSSLLLGVALLLTGHGLQLALAPLRSELMGWSPTQIGFLSSLYFCGFIAGCFTIPGLVGRIGHIRTFACLVIILTASILTLPIAGFYPAWMVLRFLTGIAIAPLTGWQAQGPEGGPFTSDSDAWVVRNHDAVDRLIVAGSDVGWAEPAAVELSVAAASEATLTMQTTAEADTLPVGRYTGTATLTPDDGSDPSTFDISLLVGTPELLYAWSLDSDPGWETEGDWEWGVPEGSGGSTGGADPSSGATGEHVYGYNLSGDYDDRQRARHLTSESFDLSGSYGATLHFQRWLGVEEAIYDNADVQVSTDGGDSWTIVWANSGEVDDRRWVDIELPLGAAADNNPDVRVRWTMGATDEGVRYCGWNIDDIEVHAILTEDSPEPEPEDTGNPTDTADTAEPEPEPEPEVDTGAPVEVSTPEDGDGKVSGCACDAGSLGAGSGLLAIILGAAAGRRREPGG